MLNQKMKLLQTKQKNKKIILIGLGNPGPEYSETRHNAGFAVIDRIAGQNNAGMKKTFLRPLVSGKFTLGDTDFYLFKPLTYMNRSGDVLSYIFRKTGASEEDVILICDNMDLKPGIIRLKNGGSSAGHNGIKSVTANIGNADYKRLYIGVGRSSKGESVVDHVLGVFDDDEKPEFEKAVSKAAEAVISLSETAVPQIMNEINRKNN